MTLHIAKSSLQGIIFMPPSKSHTLRSLLFGLMGQGKTVIHNYLASPDTQAMCRAIRCLGANILSLPNRIEVIGVGGQLKPKDDKIDAGNSGQVLRFIGALVALQEKKMTITGDHSICSLRPIEPLTSALKQLGARIQAIGGGSYAPIAIQGPITPGRAVLDGQDSQPVSGLLIATSFLPGTTELQVKNPGEKPWIDLTLHWLDHLGIRYKREGHSHYTLFGSACYEGFSTTIPADFSSAAYPLAAALVTQSEITLSGLDMSDVQGDKKIIDILRRMGALIEVENRRLTIKKRGKLQGIKIDINDCIDALAILAVIGCFAEGTTEIFNGAIARCKESDRIHAITTELRKMGAQIEERPDGLMITPSHLHGALLDSYNDHRIALALAVASLGASGKTSIANANCIAKSYPCFVQDFQRLGAHIE